uniref:Diguanylate cyclase n=1 Tax=Panagrellus redivivus TaxID=6233 RepID=A0A7E4UY15_PANRE
MNSSDIASEPWTLTTREQSSGQFLTTWHNKTDLGHGSREVDNCLQRVRQTLARNKWAGPAVWRQFD